MVIAVFRRKSLKKPTTTHTQREQITPPQGHGEPQRSASASGAAKSVLIAVNKARGRISTQNAISGRPT